MSGLEEAQWKNKYDKPHHADWAKSLDGRIRTGGMWKSAKQKDHFFRLATVQPGSQKDPITRALHKDARRKLSGVKPSHRLLITRYQVSPGNGQWFSKANIYEFDNDGLIRKWRVSRAKENAGSSREEVPSFRWDRAEVVWKRTGFRDSKENHRVLPKSNVGGKQAMAIAKYVARRHKVNTMSDKALRSTIMLAMTTRLNPIVVDYKKALLYKLGKIPTAPQNMRDWEEVIATDIEKIVASFPSAAVGEPKGIKAKSAKDDEDAHFDAQYAQYAQYGLGHEDPGVAADLINRTGSNPYESKDSMSAAVRLTGTTVAAVGVLKEGGSRTYWFEKRSGETFRYHQSKGEFDSFRNHLAEELGKKEASQALHSLRNKSREVARSRRS